MGAGPPGRRRGSTGRRLLAGSTTRRLLAGPTRRRLLAGPTRRRLLAGAAGAATLPLAGCVGEILRGDLSYDADVWPGFRRDPARTGRNADAPGPGADLARAWRYGFGAGEAAATAAAVSSPIVLGDRVIVAADFAGDPDPDANPATVVNALDAASGDRRWQDLNAYEPGPGADGRIRPAATFCSDGDRLYAMVEPGEPRLVAVDPADAATVWRAGLSAPLLSPPTPWRGELFAGRDTYVVFDADDGSRARRYEWGETVRRWPDRLPPTVVYRSVFVPIGGRLRATARAGGPVSWEARSGLAAGGEPAAFAQPVVADETLLVTAGDPSGDGPTAVVALAEDTGVERWRFRPGTGAGDLDAVGGLPLVHDGTAYVYGRVDGAPATVALDAEDGTHRWTRPGVGAPYPVAGSGTLYVQDADGVAALDPADGTVLAEASFGGWSGAVPLAAPAVVGDRLFATTRRGVVAFGPG